MNTPSTSQLTPYVEQIESLGEERDQTTALIKEKFDEMRSLGFDVQAVRTILKERKADPNKLAEQEAVVDLYKRELGMS